MLFACHQHHCSMQQQSRLGNNECQHNCAIASHWDQCNSVSDAPLHAHVGRCPDSLMCFQTCTCLLASGTAYSVCTAQGSNHAVQSLGKILTCPTSTLPLQNYKETCKDIVYGCDSDTISAKCGNGQSGSQHRYLETSLHNASQCYSDENISNSFGTLTCIGMPLV